MKLLQIQSLMNSRHQLPVQIPAIPAVQKHLHHHLLQIPVLRPEARTQFAGQLCGCSLCMSVFDMSFAKAAHTFLSQESNSPANFASCSCRILVELIDLATWAARSVSAFVCRVFVLSV